jgi:hypothetical protein
LAAIVRGKDKEGIPGAAGANSAVFVGLHVVASIRMQDEALITPATFRAAVAGHRGPLVRRQPSL